MIDIILGVVFAAMIVAILKLKNDLTEALSRRDLYRDRVQILEVHSRRLEKENADLRRSAKRPEGDQGA